MSNRRNHNISLELFSSLTPEGIHHGAFIGDSDTPLETTTSWDAIIDELFDMYFVRKGIVSAKDLDELVTYLNGLTSAAERFKNELKSCKIFDREAWLEANDGKFNQSNFNDFVKEINHDISTK